MKITLLLLATMLALTACFAQPQSGAVLFVDDFSQPESGFSRHADADATTEYIDGEYQIEVLAPHLNVWSVNGPKLAETKIEVAAHTAGGSENNLFGVVCRYRDDKHFYFLAISADGYYAIGKVVEKDAQPDVQLLSDKVFQPSDKILTGHTVNRIAATCAGQTLTLSVNGSHLAQVSDPDYADGQVGLVAGTFAEPHTDIRFDNLLVTQP